jgi:hypothetical protein
MLGIAVLIIGARSSFFIPLSGFDDSSNFSPVFLDAVLFHASMSHEIGSCRWI